MKQLAIILPDKSQTVLKQFLEDASGDVSLAASRILESTAATKAGEAQVRELQAFVLRCSQMTPPMRMHTAIFNLRQHCPTYYEHTKQHLRRTVFTTQCILKRLRT